MHFNLNLEKLLGTIGFWVSTLFILAVVLTN